MRAAWPVVLGMVALVACAPAGAGAQGGEGVTAFVGVTVLPMDEERVLRDQTVLVRDGRIEAVGPTASVTVPAGATRIDGAGRYLMPGIAEMHAHVPPTEPSAAVLEEILFLFVANGVTTIRGMLGAPYQLELRDRIGRGELLGPLFYPSSPSLNGNSAPDVETGARLVREHHAAGYDFLKIHPGISREVYDAIAATAEEVGITLAGHIPAEVGIDRALEVRQSTIDHLDAYLPSATDPARRAELVERTRAARVWNVPTVYLWEAFLMEDGPERWADLPEMRYASPSQRAAWANQKSQMLANQRTAGVTREQRDAEIAHRRLLLRELSEGGALLLMGSDAPQMFNVPGFSIHREVAVMAESGVSPYRILESGTRNVALYVAEVLGEDGRFGTVAPGNRADLLLLTANPLEDVGNLQRRAGVMVGGRWLPEEEIQRRLGEIEARHRGGD